jgi:hypothetical protein
MRQSIGDRVRFLGCVALVLALQPVLIFWAFFDKELRKIEVGIAKELFPEAFLLSALTNKEQREAFKELLRRFPTRFRLTKFVIPGQISKGKYVIDGTGVRLKGVTPFCAHAVGELSGYIYILTMAIYISGDEQRFLNNAHYVGSLIFERSERYEKHCHKVGVHPNYASRG